MLALTLSMLWAAAPSTKVVAPADKAQAKEIAAAANQDYTLGRFDEALGKYTRAFEIFPAPEFLFNIGQCHKNLAHHERAVFFFQGFLRQKPNAPNRKLVEELIAQSEQAREQEKAAEAARQREIMAASLPMSPLAANLAEQPIYKRGLFWGLLGGGVAVAAGVTLSVLFIPKGSQNADWTLDLRTK